MPRGAGLCRDTEPALVQQPGCAQPPQQRAGPDTATVLQFHITVLPTSVLGAQTYHTSLTCHGTAGAGVCNTSCKATEQDGKDWGWIRCCERQVWQELGHTYGFPYFTTMLTLCATLQLRPDLKWELDGNSSLLPFLLPVSPHGEPVSFQVKAGKKLCSI